MILKKSEAIYLKARKVFLYVSVSEFKLTWHGYQYA